MRKLRDIIRDSRAAVAELPVEFQMPRFVALDFAGTVREQCEFLHALVECSKVAEDEYAFVTKEVSSLSPLKGEVSALRSRIVDVDMPVCPGEEALAEETKAGIAHTREELVRFAELLDENLAEINRRSEALRDDLRDFTVVLFGRTKAGKSTVREALSQGSGETIGKGGQSTTKTVNRYEWQNLCIWDTPGILSVKDTDKDAAGIGIEERLACELLDKADVAIFLFATDNIETAELDYLSKVVQRGKNVLVLLNVKADMSDYKAFLLRRKDKSISVEQQSGHIDRVKEALGTRHAEIIPVHAQAAFFSRARGNPDVDAFFVRNADSGATKSGLYALSRFGDIRHYLVENIRQRGRAIRCQQIRETFVSSVETFAGSNGEKIAAAVNNWSQIVDKTEKSLAKVRRQSAVFASSIHDKLDVAAKASIDTYAIAYDCIEYGLGKGELKDRWENTLKEVMPTLPGPIVEEFLGEVQGELESLMADFDFIRHTYFSDDDTAYSLPWGDMFKIGGFVSGCLATAALVGWIPGGGWVVGGLAVLGAALGFLAGLFKSKTTKIRELKEKFDASLDNCVSAVSASVREKCERELFVAIFRKYESMLHLQKGMREMCEEFGKLNGKLLSCAEDNRCQMRRRITELGGIK